ncbi:MAG: right-handed parallel beta-helix repeat-containing protein, partial [Planctomycetota bacterium]
DNIQAGINDVNDGDVVIVSPGTYTGPGNRDIDFLGKAITVRSTDPNDPNIVAATIIDCDANRYDEHRGFYFHNGEDTNSILNGLTIINGYEFFGGGIYCYDSSPTITNCTISGNTSYSEGGGIGSLVGDISPNLKISNCIINNNTAADDGGGISCVDATITNCEIRGNTAGRTGGGIDCACSSIINCTITENEASAYGGISGRVNLTIDNCTISRNAAYAVGAIGLNEGELTITNSKIIGNSANELSGGIYFFTFADEHSLMIDNCIITENSAQEYSYGGGVDIVLIDGGNATIKNSIISGNTSQWMGGIAAYNIDASEIIIANCKITGNSDINGGGGIGCFGPTSIRNCTISGNSSLGHGGGICCYYEDSSINDCILWDNTASHGSQISIGHPYYGIDPALTVNYTDVQGGPNDVHIKPGSTLNWGHGNIDNDPCFVEPGYWDVNDTWVDGDYHLLSNSPCIDAGDPNFVPEPNETDLDGNPRVVDGNEDSIPIVDMGAYEYRPPTPAELIAELLEEVGGLGLPGGIENSLMAKLNSALAALEDKNENNDAAAINTLQAFINVVEAQRGKKIPQAEADALIAAAMEIIELFSDE